MHYFVFIILIFFVVIIVLFGGTNDSTKKSTGVTRNELMNEAICIQQGGKWSQQEDLYDDGSFDIYFVCSCPQKESDETMVIFEGGSGGCK